MTTRMKTIFLNVLLASICLAHGYVQPGLLSPEFNLNNAIVTAMAGQRGLMCYFQVQLATAGSSISVTRQIQKNVTNVIDKDLVGVRLCALPNQVSSHCYSISTHGVLIQGCLADLGFVCLMNKKKVQTCTDVDTGPVIGQAFPTEEGRATVTQASVCGTSRCVTEGFLVSAFDKVPVALYSMFDDEGNEDVTATYNLTVI